MAITACRECGDRVSTEAAVCPHCGAPAPTSPPAAAPRKPAPPRPAPPVAVAAPPPARPVDEEIIPRYQGPPPVAAPPAPTPQGATRKSLGRLEGPVDDAGRPGLLGLLRGGSMKGRPAAEHGVVGVLFVLVLLLGGALLVLIFAFLVLGIMAAVGTETLGGNDGRVLAGVLLVPGLVFLAVGVGLMSWSRWALLLSPVALALVGFVPVALLYNNPRSWGAMAALAALLGVAWYLWSRRRDFRSGPAARLDRELVAFEPMIVPSGGFRGPVAAVVSLHNRIAEAGSVAGLSPDELRAGAERAGGIRRVGGGAERQALYRVYLADALSRAAPDDESWAGLERLRDVLQLDDARTRLARQEAFRMAAHRAAADGALAPEERERLEQGAARLGLEPGWAAAQVTAEARRVAKQAMKHATHDGRLTAEEDAELNAILAGLGLSRGDIAGRSERQELQRFRTRARLETEELPTLSDTALPGETCHAVRSRVVMTREAEIGEKSPEPGLVLGRGRLLVTPERLFFDGGGRADRPIPFGRIRKAEHGPRGFSLDLGGGETVGFRFTEEVELFMVVLARAIRAHADRTGALDTAFHAGEVR